jgi:hypothetical protein
MTHQENLWLLQSIWEAFKALSPVVALALLTWGVTK